MKSGICSRSRGVFCKMRGRASMSVSTSHNSGACVKSVPSFRALWMMKSFTRSVSGGLWVLRWSAMRRCMRPVVPGWRPSVIRSRPSRVRRIRVQRPFRNCGVGSHTSGLVRLVSVSSQGQGMVSGGMAAASRRTCKEPGRVCSRSVRDCSRITDNNFSRCSIRVLLSSSSMASLAVRFWERR